MPFLWNRRKFLFSFPLFLLCSCAAKTEDAEKPDPDKDFHDWLKKKKRYRQFGTLDEAREAYGKEIDRKSKEAEWREYRRKHKLR